MVGVHRPTNLGIALMLAGCAHAGAAGNAPVSAPPQPEVPPEVPPVVEPEKHEDPWLPPGLADLRLGQPMLDVERTHTLSPADNLLAFRLDRTETFPAGPYAEVTYYFDTDLPGQPLYELIVVWRDTAARDAWTAGHGVREGNDWVWRDGAAWPVRAWTFADKYVVAASMPGTEWE